MTRFKNNRVSHINMPYNIFTVNFDSIPHWGCELRKICIFVCFKPKNTFKIKFYNYPKFVFWRILTNSSYKLCFYRLWKLHHRTPFATALRDVKKVLARGQRVTDCPRYDRGSPCPRSAAWIPQQTNPHSFACKVASEQKWQPPLRGGGVGAIWSIWVIGKYSPKY